MAGHSYLPEATVCVVADASTAINLNATGYAKSILQALPNSVYMAEAAFAELNEDQHNGRRDGELVAEFAAAGLITKVSIGASKHFEELVIGNGPQTLDDGEAASIALGIEIGGAVVIDERKARRICAERYPELLIASTMDILAHEAVQKALGRDRLADAVLNALRDARMRVLPSHGGWLVELVGIERLRECPSVARLVRGRTPAE